jgi:medium-chain acyl-[acyl-carrier-protein] hydrolase
MSPSESKDVAARNAFPGEWVAGYAPRTNAKSRLICIHHAGGGASAYRGWQRLCPENLEVIPIQLPGRENRFREPVYDDAGLVGRVLTRALSPLVDRPVAVFGHSMGALLAFELASGLQSLGLPLAHLFVSSRWAPHAPPGREPMHALPKTAFRQRLREFGGTPDSILEHEELMSIFDPVLRADLKMNETYECRWTEPLGCSITAFAAEGDRLVPPERVREWSRWTAGCFEVEMVPGDHFHFRTDPGRIVRSILSRFP